MKKITITTTGSRSDIIVGERWETAFNIVPEKGTVIITDDVVKGLYGSYFPDLPVFSITPGEGSKKLEVVGNIAEKLLNAGLDRTGFILAVGGGVVCDVAGFVAAVYMRGVRCGYVSTTLLSQVDASTGGKNGVNLGGTKNILGTFRQPEFVICDPKMLQTLPEDEYLSGLAELIKTAIIGDKELFELIEKHHDEILRRDCSLLSRLIAKSVKFKSLVVSEDEKETGLRRILNFGHTYGHAVEMQKSLKHGFAVASGMEIATEYSFEKEYLSFEEKDRIINLLRRFRLTDKHDLTSEQMRMLVTHDKKKSGTEIYFVFTHGLGRAEFEKVSVNEVLDFYKRFRDKY